MGQFRAALIDLAAGIQARSPGAAAEQARALVANRVEPALGNLESALTTSRIRFAWSTMMGASTVVLGDPIGPAAVTAGAGNVLTRNLRYAFNRDRLIRDHPYGLLYRASNEFGGNSELALDDPATDPQAEMKAMLVAIVEKIAHIVLETRSPNLLDQAD